MKIITKVRLPGDVARTLEDLARRRNCTKSEIAAAAIASLGSPDGPEHIEAALNKRLDRMSRQLERLERDVVIGNESMALFIRAWLTATPAMPDDAQAAAQAKGLSRYEGFIEALARRLAKGMSLSREISEDVDQSATGGRPTKGEH